MNQKREKKLIGGYCYADLVQATQTFCGRRTPPPLLTDGRPATTAIRGGTIGLVHGIAKFVEDCLDVEFEISPGEYARVEADLGCLARITP